MKRGRRVNGSIDFRTYMGLLLKATSMVEEIGRISHAIPREKGYLADFLKLNAGAVCSNLEEAWHLRENEGNFIAKLSEAAEAASKAQDCLSRACRQRYIDSMLCEKIDSDYESLFDDIFCRLCKSKGRATG
jgi:four helix bundle protein